MSSLVAPTTTDLAASLARVGLSAVGAWGIGVTLDAAGGPMSQSGWLAAFCVLAVGILLGPLALLWSRSRAAR